MVNPEKLATQGTQDEDKQDKNAICVGQWCFEVLTVTIIEILCPLLSKFGNDFDSLCLLRLCTEIRVYWNYRQQKRDENYCHNL